MKLRLSLLLLCLVVLSAAEARADTFQLTSGSVLIPGVLSGISQPSFTLTGPAVTVTGNVQRRTSGPFSPGQNIFLGVNLTSTTPTMGIGSITINGTTYSPPCGSCDLSVFSFSAPTIALPSGEASEFIVTAPFTMMGTVLFEDPSHNLVFLANLVGEGTVTGRFVREREFPVYDLRTLAFVFGPRPDGVTIQAVPEPATLVLLSTGLAGAVGAARRRRRAVRQDP